VDRPNEPGERRPAGAGERARLERAPGERYGAPAEPEAAGPAAPTPADLPRAIGLAFLVGLAGTGLLVLLGGVFSLTAGLIVVAGMTGWAVGQVVSTARSAAARVRSVLAASLAVDAIVLGQLGLWLYAQSEGGALGLVDYLWQTFGPLVIVEVGVAALVAWWAAR
jgi:hypothetical protein